MKPGHKVTGGISGLDSRGFGILEHEGLVLRVAGAATGDQVTVEVEHLSQHRPEGWARVTHVVSRGDSFQEPACKSAAPLRGRCGGCSLMHLTPEAQAEVKRQKVARALEGRGVSWNEPPARDGYRNRGNFVVGRDAEARVTLGSFAPRSHEVASMTGCVVHRPGIDRLRADLESWLHEQNIAIYPEPQGLRYLTIRANHEGSTLVELIAGDAEIPAWRAQLVDMLMARQEVLGVAWSVSDKPGNAIHQGPVTVLAGQGELRERVGALSLPLAARSFSQLHSEVAAQMYERAAAWVTQATVIWDLYCGSGGLGLTVARHHPGVVLWGAEVSERAISRARMQAEEREQSATYVVRDLHDTQLPWPEQEPDVILVNPPRRGLSEAVLSMLESRTGQLVYMSCNETSMARDARRLEAAGWEPLGDVEAFDMLPLTTHVEVLSSWVRIVPK